MNNENNFGGLNIGDLITVIPVDPLDRGCNLLGRYAVRSLLEVTTIGNIEIILTTGYSFVVGKGACGFSNAQYNFVIWDDDVKSLVHTAIDNVTKQYNAKTLQLKSIKGML
jgi:hypothetical protein